MSQLTSNYQTLNTTKSNHQIVHLHSLVDLKKYIQDFSIKDNSWNSIVSLVCLLVVVVEKYMTSFGFHSLTNVLISECQIYEFSERNISLLIFVHIFSSLILVIYAGLFLKNSIWSINCGMLLRSIIDSKSDKKQSIVKNNNIINANKNTFFAVLSIAVFIFVCFEYKANGILFSSDLSVSILNFGLIIFQSILFGTIIALSIMNISKDRSFFVAILIAFGLYVLFVSLPVSTMQINNPFLQNKDFQTLRILFCVPQISMGIFGFYAIYCGSRVVQIQINDVGFTEKKTVLDGSTAHLISHKILVSFSEKFERSYCYFKKSDNSGSLVRLGNQKINLIEFFDENNHSSLTEIWHLDNLRQELSNIQSNGSSANFGLFAYSTCISFLPTGNSLQSNLLPISKKSYEVISHYFFSDQSEDLLRKSIADFVNKKTDTLFDNKSETKDRFLEELSNGVNECSDDLAQNLNTIEIAYLLECSYKHNEPTFPDKLLKVAEKFYAEYGSIKKKVFAKLQNYESIVLKIQSFITDLNRSHNENILNDSFIGLVCENSGSSVSEIINILTSFKIQIKIENIQFGELLTSLTNNIKNLRLQINKLMNESKNKIDEEVKSLKNEFSKYDETTWNRIVELSKMGMISDDILEGTNNDILSRMGHPEVVKEKKKNSNSLISKNDRKRIDTSLHFNNDSSESI